MVVLVAQPCEVLGQKLASSDQWQWSNRKKKRPNPWQLEFRSTHQDRRREGEMRKRDAKVVQLMVRLSQPLYAAALQPHAQKDREAKKGVASLATSVATFTVKGSRDGQGGLPGVAKMVELNWRWYILAGRRAVSHGTRR